MSDTTLNEARRCPKCEEPGEETGKRPLERRQGVTRGAMLHEFKCRNKRCKWFDTPFFVQINPDGTVPPPQVRQKQFHALPDDGGRTVENLEALLNATRQDQTAEIRSRYA